VDENGRFTVAVLLIFLQKKSIPPTKVMPMLASSLHLNDAPALIASLYVVALTDAGGRMHNIGKLPNLGGFCLPAQLHAQPQENRPP